MVQKYAYIHKSWSSDNITLWHLRLGHMSEKGLQELYDNHSFPFSLSLQISISKNFLGENTKIYIFIFEN